MKILYLSCHEVLEYDELRLLSDLGYEMYPLGAYTLPGGEEHRKRPPLPNLPYDAHHVELALQYPQEHLHPEQLEGFDAVIIMHVPAWVLNNWHLFKDFIARGGRVIWRSIGQSVSWDEQNLYPARLEGLEVVRYSPREETIAGNIGCDALIRFAKYPDDYPAWSGHDIEVINFTQSLKSRGRFCGYTTWSIASNGLPRVVYGPGNEDLGEDWGGLLTYEEQLRAMQGARCMLYMGTYPASYTLSLMEAMLSGVPVVAVGPELGNGDMFPGQSTYEGHEIARLWSDSIPELNSMLKDLLADDKLAEQMSMWSRAKAIQLFDAATIGPQWQQFLDGGRSTL